MWRDDRKRLTERERETEKNGEKRDVLYRSKKKDNASIQLGYIQSLNSSDLSSLLCQGIVHTSMMKSCLNASHPLISFFIGPSLKTVGVMITKLKRTVPSYINKNSMK